MELRQTRLRRQPSVYESGVGMPDLILLLVSRIPQRIEVTDDGPGTRRICAVRLAVGGRLVHLLWQSLRRRTRAAEPVNLGTFCEDTKELEKLIRNGVPVDEP